MIYSPEAYPEDHPLRDPWHHDLCVCGHKRVAHYDEHAFCNECFDGRRKIQKCEQFIKASSK